MENNVLFHGVMPALISCSDREEHGKEETMRKLMRWHLKSGVTGFYLCGGTGEGPVLQKKTRMEIAEIAKDEMGGKAFLIDHIGAVDLITARDLARHAGQIGMDAISSVPPFFYHYGEKQIRQYYEELSQASWLPVLMYASPLAGVPITWDMVERFLTIPNLIGLKWTSYDYFTMHRIKALNGGNINVINGPDECLLCGLSMGADGGIGTTYNLMPNTFAKIYERFRAGDIAGAQEAQFKANRVIEVLLKYDAVAGVKASLQRMGYDCGEQVYPKKVLEGDERKAFYAEMDKLGFFEEENP